MNHTPEPSNYPHQQPKPRQLCGWCDSTHIADVLCTCTEPCLDKKGKPVGWCAKAEPGDPFAVEFL